LTQQEILKKFLEYRKYFILYIQSKDDKKLVLDTISDIILSMKFSLVFI